MATELNEPKKPGFGYGASSSGKTVGLRLEAGEDLYQVPMCQRKRTHPRSKDSTHIDKSATGLLPLILLFRLNGNDLYVQASLRRAF